MSYILDALKKSDQERQRGTVPNLQTVQVPLPGEPERRARWPQVVALALLLLNAGLLVWWLRSWHSAIPKAVDQPGTGLQSTAKSKGVAHAPVDARQPASSEILESSKAGQRETWDAPKKPSSVTKPTPVASAPPSVPSAHDNRQEPAKADASARAANRAGPREDAKPMRDMTPARPRSDQEMGNPTAESLKAAGSPPQRVDVKPTPAGGQRPDQQGRTISKLMPPPEIKETPEGSGTPVKQDLVSVEPGQADRKASPSTQASAEQGLPDVRELPLPVQREIPTMSFSMLIYSDKPGDRMININGRMMHEGQEVSPGLNLEKITPNGAILSFKGHRFHKGVL
jgi:general secretion pathway protein B